MINFNQTYFVARSWILIVFKVMVLMMKVLYFWNC
jgi:hypothetical protein